MSTDVWVLVQNDLAGWQGTGPRKYVHGEYTDAGAMRNWAVMAHRGLALNSAHCRAGAKTPSQTTRFMADGRIRRQSFGCMAREGPRNTHTHTKSKGRVTVQERRHWVVRNFKSPF